MAMCMKFGAILCLSVTAVNGPCPKFDLTCALKYHLFISLIIEQVYFVVWFYVYFVRVQNHFVITKMLHTCWEESHVREAKVLIQENNLMNVHFSPYLPGMCLGDNMGKNDSLLAQTVSVVVVSTDKLINVLHVFILHVISFSIQLQPCHMHRIV